MVISGLRTLFTGLGRLGGRLFSKLGRVGKVGYSRLGASRVGGISRWGVSRIGSGLSKFSSSRTPLLGSKLGSFRSSAIGRRLPKVSLQSVKTRAGQLGSKVFTKTRQGLKGAWRKIELDPVSTATAAYSATRTPQVKLTIDGLESGQVNGNVSGNFPNYEAFSSW